jgi:hypothetical protein
MHRHDAPAMKWLMKALQTIGLIMFAGVVLAVVAITLGESVIHTGAIF